MGLDGLCSEAGDCGEYLVGGSLPAEGLGIGVVSGDEILDGVDEGGKLGVAAAFDLALGEQAKPPFDLIEPGGMRGREVQMVAGMLQQPALDQGRLVRGIVIQDEMDLLVSGDVPVDQFQKGAKLLAAMLGKAAADHLPGGHIQSREEARGSVPEVVRGAALQGAWPHG